MDKYDLLANRLREILQAGQVERQRVTALLAERMPGSEMERERHVVGAAIENGILEAIQAVPAGGIDLEIYHQVRRLEDRFAIREEVAAGVVSAIAFGLGRSDLPSQRPLRLTEAQLPQPTPSPAVAPRAGIRDRSGPISPPANKSSPVLAISLLVVIALGVGAIGYLVSIDAFDWSHEPQPSPPESRPTDAAPPLSPAPLILENVRLEPVAGSDRAILATGDIVNTSTADVTPRRIRFVFRDQNRYTIGQMIFDLKPDRIPPMGRQRFRQRVDDPPQGAVAVDVAVDPME